MDIGFFVILFLGLVFGIAFIIIRYRSIRRFEVNRRNREIETENKESELISELIKEQQKAREEEIRQIVRDELQRERRKRIIREEA